VTVSTLIIGGTVGIGRELARQCAADGESVVIAGRDAERAARVAHELGGPVSGIGVDLAAADGIEDALSSIDKVDQLVLAATESEPNPVADFDLELARRLLEIKLVGYTETIRVLRRRMPGHGAVVLFGGQARVRLYPGSTMITAANAAIDALVRTLAIEVAPVRVNAVHPGLVHDSPRWAGLDLPEQATRTVTGEKVTMSEVAAAVRFLLGHRGIDGTSLVVDGGWALL
jgi:NAD(P)-dependent dehydrogenase (short-subunit alcohol dehydrogenase family)